MADISDINSALPTKIVGSDSVGLEQTPVQSTVSGALHSNLRDNTGVELGTSSNPLFVSRESIRQTYSATAAAFTPAASATDVFTITGSATKTVIIKKIRVSGSTTSGSAIKLTTNLIRRSTVDTGGTRVAATVIPNDTNNAAGTATVGHYTANPTLGTAVGTVRSIHNGITNTGMSGGDVVFELGDNDHQGITLRGTTQQLAVNFNSTTITGGIISISVEWVEI